MDASCEKEKVSTPFPPTEEDLYIKVTGKCVCPQCGNSFVISIPKKEFEEFKANSNRHLFSHMYLHGNPCHGLEVQLDKDLRVRHHFAINSLQVDQNNVNFAGVMRLWMRRK